MHYTIQPFGDKLFPDGDTARSILKKALNYLCFLWPLKNIEAAK